jgi:hypothetical protein
MSNKEIAVCALTAIYLATLLGLGLHVFLEAVSKMLG